MVREARRVSVEALCIKFQASAATIRRDLNLLEERGMVLRVHGGVVATGPESTLSEKQSSHVEEKRVIARRALEFIDDGDMILLDAGTTTGILAEMLHRFDQLTVVTNAVNILNVLLGLGKLEVIMLGGTLRPINQAVIGPITEDNLHHIRPDKVFLGVYGLNLIGQFLASPTLQQAHLKEEMMKVGRHCYILADHTKLGETHFGFVTPMMPNTTLITDKGVTPKQERLLKASGINFFIS